MRKRPGRTPRLGTRVASVLCACLTMGACTVGADRGPEAQESPTALGTEPSPSREQAEENPDGAATMRVRPVFFGMHDGRLAGGLSPDAPIGSLRLWDTGTTWLEIEPEPGVFDWTRLDEAVRTAESTDARPLLVLGQTPVFHAKRSTPEAFYGPSAASMPELDAWRRYVGAVAQRYGNRVDYQVWNEANVSGFWTGTPRQMADLTVVTSQVVRDVVPKATVVAPAFAMRLAGQRRFFEKFWSQQDRGIDLARAVDVVSLNLYPAAEDLPEAQAELLEGARGVLADRGVDLPVWNTEINYGLTGSKDHPEISAERQRAFVMRTYLLNAGLGVERVYWYSWNLGPIASTNLFDADQNIETSAGESFDVLREWMDGAKFGDCSPSDRRPGLWRCLAMAPGERLEFWWRSSGSPVKVSLDGSRAWQDADGTIRRCSETCRVQIGETPVRVEWRR